MPTGPSKINYGGPIENSGMVYRVIPLNTNLSQKGNDKRLKEYNKSEFNLGDYVSGICIYDNKQHIGHIVNMVFNEENSLLYVYIMDKENRITIPLDPSTIDYSNQQNILNDIKENMKSKNYIKYLIEAYNNKNLPDDLYYKDSTYQMKKTLSKYNSEKNKYDKNYQSNIELIQTILGKNTYRKIENNGVFAPLYLTSIKLNLEDFASLDNTYKKGDSLESAEKLIGLMKKNEYYRNSLSAIDDGYNMKIKTDIVFKDLDELIFFFITIYKYFQQVYKKKDINWNSIVKKIRNYLK